MGASSFHCFFSLHFSHSHRRTPSFVVMSQSPSSPLAEHISMELNDTAIDVGAPDVADAAAAAALTVLSSDVVAAEENLGQ
jgi:hypothetical protein